MPLVEFEWEDEIQDLDGAGRCVVGYARDEKGKWFRLAIALSELEEAANRRVNKESFERKH
jgi:hypothetical protein